MYKLIILHPPAFELQPRLFAFSENMHTAKNKPVLQIIIKILHCRHRYKSSTDALNKLLANYLRGLKYALLYYIQIK